MATNAGVWIDHKQAIVIRITDAGTEIKKIAFNLGQQARPNRGRRSKQSHTPNDFVAEDTLQRRIENDRKHYFDEVIDSTQGAAAVLILGPGEAKGEMLKRIKSKKRNSRNVEMETADKMTERQLIAKVRTHFSKVPVKNTAAPSSAAKALLGKRKRKA
jgi:stalled ribosome rescue protein Dom34